MSVKNEPVGVGFAVVAAANLLTAFDLYTVTQEQLAAVNAVAAVVIALVTRRFAWGPESHAVDVEARVTERERMVNEGPPEDAVYADDELVDDIDAYEADNTETPEEL